MPENKYLVAAAQAFSLLALAGFFASLIAHIAGYAGIDRPLGIDPWPLHVGIFVVWLPAVLAAQRLAKDFPQKDMWKASLRGCPGWMRYFFYGLFAYALLSFVAFALTGDKSSKEASVIRGFSGHWLIFYFAAYAILHSYARVGASDTERRCINRHRVEPAHEYCPQCGAHAGSALEHGLR